MLKLNNVYIHKYYVYYIYIYYIKNEFYGIFVLNMFKYIILIDFLIFNLKYY